MAQYIMNGGSPLVGEVAIGGAKNAALGILAAAIMTDEDVYIDNLPDVKDINVMLEAIKAIGASVDRLDRHSVKINASSVKDVLVDDEFIRRIRASYYFIGALLGKYKSAEVALPGGCNIGSRPIDLHLKGFKALGAEIEIESGRVKAHAIDLVASDIYLDTVSVGATINIMLAAALAKGTTIIHNAAKEPEIINVATFINNMGGKITGAGTGTIKIEGVEELEGCFDEIIPDRIEAGTYLMLGALTSKRFKVYNIIPEHLSSLVSKLQEMKVKLDMGDDYITIYESNNLKPINVQTLIYPGFATDLQQPLSTLLTKADGVSSIEETIWENRFMHVKELNKMGAKISVVDNKAYITGPTFLKGTEVVATDLRGGAAVLLAGLAAVGKTRILNAEHILRGYEGIENKLIEIGADIKIIDE